MMCAEGAILPPAFFQRDALTVTRELLGQTLCRLRQDGTVERWCLTELEAYIGPEDLACHASKGKTARTAVMFEPGGVCYIYLCYGIHWMLNFVTGPGGHPAAVLVRGIGQTNGPGRVTRALGVDKALNTLPLSPPSGLWIEDCGQTLPESRIERTARIGINYAGDYWREQPLRFVLKCPKDG